ncbi:MAG: cytochrome c [Candidatus Acidiferrales bacterium]
MKAQIVRAVLTALLFLTSMLMSVRLAYGQTAADTFKTKCAVCHGADGSGDTPVGKGMKLHDLRSADVQKQTDAELTAIITNGKGGMPAYKDKLSSDQIKQLVAFIRQMAKKS